MELATTNHLIEHHEVLALGPDVIRHGALEGPDHVPVLVDQPAWAGLLHAAVQHTLEGRHQELLGLGHNELDVSSLPLGCLGCGYWHGDNTANIEHTRSIVQRQVFDILVEWLFEDIVHQRHVNLALQEVEGLLGHGLLEFAVFHGKLQQRPALVSQEENRAHVLLLRPLDNGDAGRHKLGRDLLGNTGIAGHQDDSYLLVLGEGDGHLGVNHAGIILVIIDFGHLGGNA